MNLGQISFADYVDVSQGNPPLARRMFDRSSLARWFQLFVLACRNVRGFS